MKRNRKKGAALGLVLVILLMATLLVMSLLKMPGGIRRNISLQEKKMQSIYSGESALIARMEQFPRGYFNSWGMNLPEVAESDDAVWRKMTAGVAPYGNVNAYAGVVFRPLGREEIQKLEENLKNSLKWRVMNDKKLQKRSGSRRLTGKTRNMTLSVTGGDLTVDLSGEGETLNFMCDGESQIKGDVLLDTLRLYSLGNVKLSGSVKVRHLEIFSGGSVELSRHFSYSGLLMGKNGVSFGGKSSMIYPAVAVSSGGVINVSSLKEKNLCQDSLSGTVRTVSVRRNTSMPDRHLPHWDNNCLLPASLEGKLQAFRWSLE